jgi:hypothetical protein
MTSCKSRILSSLLSLLAASAAFAQTVEQVSLFKGTSFWQTSAAAPIVDPSPPGANYVTPPNNGGPYVFKIKVAGTNLNSITAPTVTLPAGSTYPTQNPTRHNGGVLGYNANQQSWGYGVDANNYSAPTAAERDTSLAFGTYGLNILGTSFNLNFPDTSFHENTPSVTLTGGTWVRGRYLIDVTQPLTITTNAFTNFNKNADGAMQLAVDGVFDQLTFYSDNHSAGNFLTYTIPANTLVAGTDYTAEAAFFAIMDRSTAIAGSLTLAAYVGNTNFRITAYAGTLPSATLQGIGDLPGGIVSSEVRDVTRVNDVLFAVGAASANTGSTGRDTGVIWTTTGGLKALPNLATNTTGTTFVTASAITPDAAYIAARSRNVASGGTRNAVRVTTSGLINLDLGGLAGTSNSAAVAISSNGSILYGLTNNNSQAVRYTASGPAGALIPFLNAGDNQSGPAGRGCSADGSVMVGTSTNTNSGHNGAFRYVQGTGVSAVPYLAGGTWNLALAVSPDGHLTLANGNSASAPQGEFYLHNATTSAITPLGTPDGNRGSFGSGGMTADGSVVVASINGGNGSASYVHNSHGWHNLQTVAAAAGVNLTGWTLDPVAGMSADGTLVWGMGTHNGNPEGFVVDFAAGYLAAYTEPLIYSTPGAAIVGAWLYGDTTSATDGAGLLIFSSNGYYMHIQIASAAESPSGVAGFERGQYTWDANTGLLKVTTLLDTNGDIGMSNNDGNAGIQATVLGNTLALNGGAFTLNRVAGSSPIVGAFGNANISDNSAAVVFLANGYYYLAQDGDSTPAGDPSGHDGMEWGTYTWNPTTGAFTATALIDTNGQWGLSNPSGPQTITFSGDRLTLTLGTPSGSFPLSRVGAPFAVDPAADLDGDGKSDLLWQNTVTGERYVWLMNKTGFMSGVSIGTIPTQWEIATTGDFNGDGKTDFVWQNTSTGERLVWLMNGASFQSSVPLGTLTTDWLIAAAGDFNGDGQTDLVWQNTITGERVIWLMNGTAFQSSVSLGVMPPQWSVASAADFNGDGKPDLVWQNLATGERTLWLMNGTSFASAVPLGIGSLNLRIAQTGDFNDDGQSDIVLQDVVTGERFIWLMNGVAPGASVSLGVTSVDWVIGRTGPKAIVHGDFDRDGKSDFVWENSITGDRYIWLMNGTTFSSSAYLGNLAPAWSIAGSGDFNGDNQSDLVWENAATGDRYVWLMNGTTFSSSAYLGNVASQWHIAGTGDFDGDGRIDLVWENTTTGDRYVWLMNGTTFISAVSLGNLATAWHIAGTGDFNGDGRADLVWENTTTGDRYIWLMDGTTFTSAVSLGNLATAWHIAGTGDFNGDGNTDLVWENSATGDRYVWLMNGTTFSSSVHVATLDADWHIRN